MGTRNFFGPCVEAADGISASGWDLVPGMSFDGLEYGMAGIHNTGSSPLVGIKLLSDPGANGDGKRELWVEFYMFVARYPSGADQDILSFDGALQSGNSLFLKMSTTGILKTYNQGNATPPGDLLYTHTAAIPLNTWTKIGVHVKHNTLAFVNPDPPYETNASYDLRINGVDVVVAGTAPTPTTGGSGLDGINNRQDVVAAVVGRLSTTNAFEVYYSHFVIDDTGWPGASRITLVPVSGPGTYSNWAGGTPDWRARLGFHKGAGTQSGAVAVTTTTPSSRQSYAVKSLTSMGITGTIKSAKVIVNYTNDTAGSAILFIRRNGVDIDSGLFTKGTGWSYVFFENTAGWLPTDTFEVGVISDNAAGTTGISGIALLIEHTTAAPAIVLDNTVEIDMVSWAATGALMEVDLPFEPDLMFVWHRTGNGPGGFWHRKSFGITEWDGAVVRVGFQVDGTKLYLLNNTNVYNTAGVTYDALVIRDDAKRIFDWGAYLQTYHSAIGIGDDVQVNTAWQPDAVMAYPQTANTSQNTYFKPGSLAGDASIIHSSSAAPSADAIQAINANGFVAGTLLHTTTNNIFLNVFLALRATGFFRNKLFAITTFVGTGAAHGETVDLDGEVPEWAIIYSHGAHLRWMRNSQQSESDPLNGGTTVDAQVITGFAADTVNVGTSTNANASGTTYTILAFRSGIDAPQDEVEFDDFAAGDVGLSWMELIHVDSAGLPKTYKWSPIALPDPSHYYGGFKEPRVIQFSDVTRALSNSRGQFEGVGFSVRLADTDRLLRGWLDNSFQKFIQNRTGLIRSIDDARRRLLDRPRIFVRGKVQTYKPIDPLAFEITCEDPFSVQRGTTSVEKLIPFMKIGLTDFPNCPAQNLNKPVPIAYGLLEDKDESTGIVGIITNSNVTAQVIGAAGTSTYRYTITAVAQWKGPDATNSAQDNDHRTEMVWGQVLVTNAPSPSEWSATRYVRLLWNNVGEQQRELWWGGINPPNPHSRIYGRSTDTPQQLIVGFGTQAANNIWNDDMRAPRAPYSKPPGINEVILSGDPNVIGSSITVDHGRGVVPTIYVGKREISGTTFDEFLVCGHAIKAITGWYLGGIRQVVAPANELDNDLQTWLIPGYAAWNDRLETTVPYRDYNGRRYTTIFAHSERLQNEVAAAIDGSKPLTVNVQGIETIGDGTGTVISKLAEIYKHFAINYLLQNWDGGLWNTVSPSWPADVDGRIYPQLDTASFDTVRAIHDLRIEGGYIGGILFGGVNEGAVTAREAMARLNLSNDCQCGFNRNSQLFVSILGDDGTVFENSRVYTNQSDIVADSFDLQALVDQVENTVVYNYGRRYAPLPYNPSSSSSITQAAASGWEHTGVELSDAEAIVNMAGTDPSPEAGIRRGAPVDLWAVRDATIAADIMQRRLMLLSQPPLRATFQVGIRGLNDELGSIIRVTHFGGTGLTGWEDRPVRIMRVTANPGSFMVRFETIDVDRLFAAGFVLGDETVQAATWLTATDADKKYGYLANETTGTFSNGDPGKRLR